MILSAALLACAVNVSPVTLQAIMDVESHGNVLALNVNGLIGPQPRASSMQEAVTAAYQAIAAGRSIDLGLMQINSKNLNKLGVSVEDMFDPCKNINAAGRILSTSYREASIRFGEGQTALLKAISAYNTGNFSYGFSNGYVSKVTGRHVAGDMTQVPAMSKTTKDLLAIRYAASSLSYVRPGAAIHVPIY